MFTKASFASQNIETDGEPIRSFIYDRETSGRLSRDQNKILESK